jgi:four helix bundle suffix protein
MTNRTDETNLFFKHGGYRNLQSFQMSTLIFDLTVEFCKKFIDRKSRTKDQMEQAARSGRQNIAEGSSAAATSKKTEIKLTNVARASLEELLLDYEDFLRQHKLKLWIKENPEAKKIRNLAYNKDRSYSSYQSYLQNPEFAANMLVCLIHQANYLLDKQLKTLSEEFMKTGGFTERLYQKRMDYRKNNF